MPSPRAHFAARTDGWPWAAALVLFSLFAGATWAWDASQRWYETSTGDVNAMVDRISDGQLSRQASFALLGLWGLCGVFLPAQRPTRLKLLIAYPLMVFCAWAFISIMWSTDTQQTAKRLVVFGAMILAVLSTVRRYDAREVAQIAFIASGLTMLCGIGNEMRILITDSPVFSQWRFGGTMHPNHAGLNCLVVMLSSLYLYRFQKQRLFLLTFAIGTLILLVTKSRTALMASITGCGIFLLLATTIPRAALGLLAGAWLIAGALWLSSLQMLPDLNDLASMGRDDIKKADVKQLTGRTDIWKFAVMQAGRDPNRTFVGYGYETFWTPTNARGVSDFVKFKISEGHCVYLDWYLELGLVGAGLYVFILLTSLLRWGKAAVLLQSPAAALAAAVLAAVVVHGLAESSLGDANLPTFMSYAAMAAAAFLRNDEDIDA
ncbi:MAG: O-antigen ligase family protein [Burkholderiales bacterium]|nr:O-antigen ligase family protein [Phycisphaerae bacterium]